jgi:hypothetical protein
MSDVIQRFTVAVTMDRGEGAVWECKIVDQWKEESGGASAPWCFAMQVTSILETLRPFMTAEEWDDFISGVKTIGDDM